MSLKRKYKEVLTRKKPEKGLLRPLKKRAGRSRGRITVRHRGGGAKRRYRLIDWGQEKKDVPARVLSLEYDPNRTAFIALLEFKDGEKRYILSPQDLKVGDEIIVAEKTELKPGNRMRLKHIPPGILVYNIELQPGKGGQLIRSAGTSARILAHKAGYSHLKMPSGEIRKVKEECFASLGQVSKPWHRFIKDRKAGDTRHKGRRPQVRGSAMNPVDHPHGGGEGKTPIGLPHPKTPWGKIARGVKTRRRKWTDKYIIERRRKK